MRTPPFLLLQSAVFGLVAAGFTTIYLTQPVLPVLQGEFGVNEATASLTVSALILGIALSNLPFGVAADTLPIRPILLTGGLVIAAMGGLCFWTTQFRLLVAARFVQGLFLPALTTCLAAYLSKTLPEERLNTVMGAYIAATVAGGLGGRLIGGWLHDPAQWRSAFLTTAGLVVAAVLAAAAVLPGGRGPRRRAETGTGFLGLLGRPAVLGYLAVSFSAFYVFSSVFNYLPFYLSGPPFEASTRRITAMYLSYVFGIAAAPVAGRLCNRIGNGKTMAAGAVIFLLAIGASFLPWLPAVAASLAGVCSGFFAIHTAAIGGLNRRLKEAKGRANALYVLSYYLGGAVGVSVSGYAYRQFQWSGVAVSGALLLAVPLLVGAAESRPAPAVRERPREPAPR